MTKTSTSIKSAALPAETEPERFDHTSILLHWLTVLLLLAQFSSASLHEAAGHHSPLAATILTVHRSLGAATLIVVLARLVWRCRFAYLPPFPPSMPRLQQSLAKLNEYGLYVLLVLQPVAGLGRELFRGQPFQLLFWQVPELFARNPPLRNFFAAAHEFGAKALLALIVLHVAAALFHRLVLRDGVLHRMLPWRASLDRPDEAAISSPAYDAE